MRILFICSCLEEGRDGVGDYTRRLAGELIAHGHEISLLSIHDKYINGVIVEEQYVTDKRKIPVMRVSSTLPYGEKKPSAEKWILEYNPSWISLQYVCYGFHRKGLPIGLASFLERIGANRRWHIMFHELWIGMNEEASWKHKLQGLLQKYLIQNLVLKLKPTKVSTHAEVYQWALGNQHISSEIFPLFSNIKRQQKSFEKKQTAIELVIFGHLFPNVPFVDFIDDIAKCQLDTSERFRLIFVGRNGSELNKWSQKCIDVNVDYEIKGELVDTDVSIVLGSSRFGVTTTPFVLTQKSGVVAALVEHSLPVLCVSFEWNVSGFVFQNNDIFRYEKGNFRKLFENMSGIDVNTKSDIATTFINILSQ